jgi:hypothetical protein
MRRPSAARRRGGRVSALAAVALLGSSACSGSGSRDEGGAAVETLPPTTALPTGECDVVPIGQGEALPAGVDPSAPPTLPEGVDTGYAGSGPGSGNPYVVPGGRQVPGPDMTVTTLGPEPLVVAVAVPPNPDVGTPAAMAPGVTTPPTPPTTLPPAAAPAPEPAGATTTTGLMALADDPGCVAAPGDP